MKRTNRLLSLLLVFIMVLTLVPTTVFAAGGISEVDVNGIVAPVAGEVPQINVSAPAGAKYTLRDESQFNANNTKCIKWSDLTARTTIYQSDIDAGYKFIAGHQYSAFITFMLNDKDADSWAAKDSITAKLNGKTSTQFEGGFDASYKIINAEQGLLFIEYVFPICGNEDLTITLPDIESDYVCSSVAKLLTYRNGRIANTEGLSFGGGSGTIVKFEKLSGPDWLEVNKYNTGFYEWIIEGNRPATPQAATTMTVRATDSDGNTAEYTLNVGAVLDDSDTVKEVNVNGIVAPVAGEVPQINVSAPAGAKYTLRDESQFNANNTKCIKWSDLTARTTIYQSDIDAGYKFIAGHQYSAFITFMLNDKDADSWAAKDSITAKLNGKTSTQFEGGFDASYKIINAEQGLLFIEYVFPTLATIPTLTLDYGGSISQNGGYARAEIGSTRYTATTEVKAGAAVTIKPVSLENYVFDHWVLSSNITLTEGSTTSETIKFTMPDADVTVKPVFKKITYSISYDLNGGSWNGAAGVGEYEAESEVTLPTNVTKSGYDFLGWYEHEGAYWYGPYDKITTYDSGNKTFTAKWKTSADAEFPIKVRIDNTAGRTDKGATVALDKAAAAGGETVTVQVNVKDGYTLDSVSIAKRGGRGQITLNDLGNGKYTFTMPSDFSNTNTNYAEITVKTTKNTYNITWDLNGGEKTGSWNSYYKDSYTVTDYGFDMPTSRAVKKDGYKLVGWYTNSACTGGSVTRQEQGETGNKTYYAKWEKDTYTVNVDTIINGTVTVDRATAQMGDTVTVTVTPNPGYKMKAGSLKYSADDWTTAIAITGNTFTMPGGNVRVVAAFEPDDAFEYTIDVEGGTAYIAAGTPITKASKGTIVKLSATVPEGKTFKEWEVVSGSTTITHITSATDAVFVMPAGYVKINAVFIDNTPALTPITNVAATVTAPAIGAHPDYSATAVTTPDGSVKTVRVTTWVKMAKADYLAGSSDWIALTSTDVFEAGYYYGTTVEATAKDGYSFTASTTGTVNGGALFSMSHTEDTIELDYLFEPLTASEYDIIVTNGKATVGAGSEISKAANGTVVTITADPAEAGKQFDKWEVIYGGVTIADVNSATTTFTMGSENVKVRATYKDAAPSHTHTYGEVWKSDDTNHWKECTDTACPDPAGSVKDKAAHTASDWIIDTAATATADGAKHKECTVCHKVLETATIPATGSGHTHAYGETWKSDADNHWHECDCGDKADIAAHSFAWKIDREATKTETGLKHEECSVCGAKRNENTVIDKLPDGGNTNPGGNTGNDGNNTNKPSKDDSTKSPQTGDTSNIIGWLGALFVSGGILTVLGVTAKKKKESEAE